MKRVLGWLLALAVFAGAAIWIRATYFSDDARIRRTIRGLLADVSFTEGTGNLAKAAKFNAVAGRFTDDISISIEQVMPLAPALTGRDELHQAVHAVFTRLKWCDVTLHDVVVEPVATDAHEARAAFTASVVTGLSGVEFAAQEFEVQLRKNPVGKWQLSQVTAIRTLKR